MNRTLLGLVLLCSMAAMSGGCHRTPVAVTNSEPPTLPVSKPVQRQVTDYGEFTGRTVAVNSVDIRPRVTGYLTKMTYREGAEVKKDELLFEIDPRPYQAQYDQAVGQVNLNNAALRLARTTLARDQAVASKSQGAVSLQELDQDRAAVDEADARVKAAQAALEAYKLNLSFTKVTSPIDGQVSRYYLTLGNLVNQDQTLLTTVVSLDPMYVYFDMDEPTLLRIKRAINEGRIKLPQPGADIPVYMALEGEEGYPHRGNFNFLNNQVNPATGTISVRGGFSNAKPPNGTRLLLPGMFVRTRLPIGQPYEALLVIDRAIGSDQGLKYLYVVDKENKVQYRRIQTGPLQDDGLRVIREGLQADEEVVIGGIQQLRPRMPINPEPIAMPSIGPEQPPGSAQPKAPSGTTNTTPQKSSAPADSGKAKASPTGTSKG
ncbi:MAG TPA: efflux RND transporter periplasmic adaptor subunit [Gemmataceae bacterium]|nr:efflux RND transporter periplasmic adaptor subunit [Gemmataceae bacterium]